MSAATADINTSERYGETVSLPIAASTIIYAGTLVALNSSGQLVSASDASGLTVVGRAEAHVDNSADGTGGVLSAPVKRGVFGYQNAASTNNVTAALVGDFCYVYDNQTVGKKAGTTYAIKAGLVVDFDSVNNIVWVDTRRSSGAGVTQTSANAAGSTPTQTEFNKVVADITAIINAIN